jgi:hypothetical protein
MCVITWFWKRAYVAHLRPLDGLLVTILFQVTLTYLYCWNKKSMACIKPFHLLLYLILISYFEMFYEYENEVWNDLKLVCWAKGFLVWVLDLSTIFHLEFIEYFNNLFDCKAPLMNLNLFDSKTIQCT